MSIQLSELNQEIRTIEIPFGEKMLNVKYHVHGYTGEIEAEILSNGERMPASTMARILSKILVEWDLMNGEEAYPTTEGTLAKLSLTFLTQVLTAIAQDMRPNPPNAGS